THRNLLIECCDDRLNPPPGIPRAMVFTLISRSPRCTGLLVTVAFRIIIPERLGASFGAPGPRVFTSADCRSSAGSESPLQHACGHRIPCPTSRDDREASLSRARDDRSQSQIQEIRKKIIFRRRTGQAKSA
ncbi:hypothetical protein, partial [Bradyrhizobium sp. SRS-191]|uniref:hypothetical protein n=1 Tax=Bradyrhizobium sp. SRS-191 TaxID=2962606 RepID=UPI00211DD439